MASRSVHVTPNPAGGWQVKRAGNVRPSSTHRLKRAAIDAGKRLAKRYRAELVIHRKDGRIGTGGTAKRSFGRDPRKTKG